MMRLISDLCQMHKHKFSIAIALGLLLCVAGCGSSGIGGIGASSTQGSTTTTLTSSANPVSPTNATSLVTFTATINPPIEAADKVTFYNGGNSIGTGTVSSGVATLTVTVGTLATGNNIITAKYAGDGSYSPSTSNSLTEVVSSSGSTTSGSGGSGSGGSSSLPFTNYTTTNGLGSNHVMGIALSGTTIYAATQGGLSVSANGGQSWTNYTTTSGLGSNWVNGVYVDASGYVYAATKGGLSISTNGGASWTNYTPLTLSSDMYATSVYGTYIYAAGEGGLVVGTLTNGVPTWGAVYTNANSLGNTWVNGVAEDISGSPVYVATQGGLSASASGAASLYNGTATWTNYDSPYAPGMPTSWINGVSVFGSTIYGATNSGLIFEMPYGGLPSVGNSLWNVYTTANGLGSNVVYGVSAYREVICAATAGGLSISTNGSAFTNYTTTSGLGSNTVYGGAVSISDGTVYAATAGGVSIWTQGLVSPAFKKAVAAAIAQKIYAPVGKPSTKH